MIVLHITFDWIERKGTGDSNAASTATTTVTVESQPSSREQKVEEASPEESEDKHLSDDGTKEKEEPLEDEFAGLFGGGRWKWITF